MTFQIAPVAELLVAEHTHVLFTWVVDVGNILLRILPGYIALQSVNFFNNSWAHLLSFIGQK